MAKRFFNKVYYRAKATPITTATKGGTYPDYTFSGWTLLVGGIAEKAKIGLEPDGEEQMGDGSAYVSGEKAPVEIMVKDFTAANYSTIKAALTNVAVDVMMLDSDQPGIAYAAFGLRLYPAPNFTSGEEPVITIKGERKAGTGVSIFSPVTVS